MLILVRKAGDDVAGKDDHSGAGELLHRSERSLQLGQEGVADGRISDSIMQPGGCIEADAELFGGGDGFGEVGFGPLGIFADEFHVGVASLRNLGDALFEGEISEDGPEHDREREGSTAGLGSLRSFGAECRSGERGGSYSLGELTTVHRVLFWVVQLCRSGEGSANLFRSDWRRENQSVSSILSIALTSGLVCSGKLEPGKAHMPDPKDGARLEEVLEVFCTLAFDCLDCHPASGVWSTGARSRE